MSSSVGDLLLQLRQACGQLPVAELRELAQRILDELRPALNSAVEGSSGYELSDALGLLGRVAGDLEEAAALFAAAGEYTETYAADVGQAAGSSEPLLPPNWTPPTGPDGPGSSSPHPSTRQAAGLQGALDPRWAQQVAERLPERPVRGAQTHGLFFGPDGTSTPMISGSDQDTARIDLALLNSQQFPEPPPGAQPAVSKHVETKAALRMLDSGTTYGVLVLNNRVCGGMLNCERAVPAILPAGYTLVIWQPGATTPLVLEGRAT